MNDAGRRFYAAMVANLTWSRSRLLRDDRGEGVISTAIAVLIMAFIGALMWIGFKQIFSDAQDKTAEQINNIGG